MIWVLPPLLNDPSPTVGAAENAFRMSTQILDLNHQAQLTQCFTTAVEQLGHKSRDVHIGAIHALAAMGRRFHLEPLDDPDRQRQGRSAKLQHANLRDAELEHADLGGAWLDGAIPTKPSGRRPTATPRPPVPS